MTAATARQWWGDTDALDAFGRLLEASRRNPAALRHARVCDLVCPSCNRAAGTAYRTDDGTVVAGARAATFFERYFLDGLEAGIPDDDVTHSALMAVYRVTDLPVADDEPDVELQCRCRRRVIRAAWLAEACTPTRRRRRVLLT